MNLVGLREGRVFSSYFGFMLARYQEYATPTLLLLICIDVVQIALKFISVLTSLFDVIVTVQYTCTWLKIKSIIMHFALKLFTIWVFPLVRCSNCYLYQSNMGGQDAAPVGQPAWEKAYHVQEHTEAL